MELKFKNTVNTLEFYEIKTSGFNLRSNGRLRLHMTLFTRKCNEK